jgi:heptosyltransferase III
MTRVLFITANRIGDAILSTGLLRHTVAAYPEAKITIACGPLCTDLFIGVPNLERIITLPKQSWNRHWLKLWWECWAYRWDVIIDLRNSLVSRILSHGKLFAYAGAQPEAHKVLQNAAIMRLVPPPEPKIWLSADQQAAAHALLGDAPFIALGPAANWPPKQWPAEYFVALAQLFLADPAYAQHKFLVLAAAHEHAQIAPLLAALPPERCVPLIGGSLAVAAAALARAALYIGNDSGLMHLAAACGTPTLGLFGPGYEKLYGPWGTHTLALRTPESTADLLARLPNPAANTPNLMASLAVERVWIAAQNLLAQRDAHRRGR